MPGEASRLSSKTTGTPKAAEVVVCRAMEEKPGSVSNTSGTYSLTLASWSEPPRPRLPHPSRFSKGGYYRPANKIHPTPQTRRTLAEHAIVESQQEKSWQQNIESSK